MVFEQATEFLRSVREASSVALIMDTDVDGLSGGRVVEFCLQKRGVKTLPIFPAKGGYATSPEVVEQVKAFGPDYVVTVDTGSSDENPYYPVPYLVIDHHKPLGGTPPKAVFCSAFGREPTEPASLMAYLICREFEELEEVEWLGILGVFGDLGDSKVFPEWDSVARKYGKTHFKQAVSLLNAARRSSVCDAGTAYEVLCWATSLKDISRGDHPLLDQLKKYKEEVAQALEEASRIAPRFAGENTLIEIASPCLIHGMLASRWVRRLPRQRVLVANRGYLPGQVVFSFRTLRKDDLITYLEELLAGEEVEGSYGFGHRQATGGRLSPSGYKLLRRKLEF